MPAASGRVAVSGGRDTTFVSRSVAAVTRADRTATVSGTTSTGARFTRVVADGGVGRDRVTVTVNGRTESGPLTNGDVVVS